MINNVIVSEGIEYILQHLYESITLVDVARHCCMSVSRFSAIFKEQTGESVYSFVKRLKMEQSAFRLKLETERSITDIGESYGYSSSNYSWAFRQHHKVSPAQFRKTLDASGEEIERIIKRIDSIVRYEIKPDYEVMLIGIWFPAKNLELDERYAYDQYYFVREDGYMEFDICIPVK